VRRRNQPPGRQALPLSALEPPGELRHLTAGESRDRRRLPWRLVRADDSRRRLVIVVNLGSTCKIEGAGGRDPGSRERHRIWQVQDTFASHGDRAARRRGSPTRRTARPAEPCGSCLMRVRAGVARADGDRVSRVRALIGQGRAGVAGQFGCFSSIFWCCSRKRWPSQGRCLYDACPISAGTARRSSTICVHRGAPSTPTTHLAHHR
jgi:hypothetical protein